jgi:hypothetical protein
MKLSGQSSSRAILAAGAALALLACAGCEKEPKVNVVKAVLDQDEAQYRQQAALYDEQLKTTARQIERTEQQMQRSEALLARWEKQADRYDAILARWEKQSGARPQ